MTRSMMRPDEKTIQELKAAGYSVNVVSDQDPSLYAWINKSGASQHDVKDRQPYRRSELQAWADCEAYHSSDVPAVAEPDWVSNR